MPELPDVETMRRYLQATSLHREIEAVDVHSDQMMEHTSVQELRQALIGRSFDHTCRHGKVLFVALDEGSDDVLLLHFGMTGGLAYFKAMEEEPAYDRLLLHFANGYHLAYYAMRKLGQVEVIDDVERFVRERGLGPDVLDPAFDLATFKELVEGRRVMTKAFLMDQHTVAGIGNVYADEILFQVKIHPRTKINRLDEETLEDLFHAVKDVLEQAIACRAQPDRFPDTFIAPHRHEGGKCPICGAELERVKVSSRTAYYCPECQPKEG